MLDIPINVLCNILNSRERYFSSRHESEMLDALPLIHRGYMESEVYYEVHMTLVLHTSRISNVDSTMFVDRNKGDGKF